MSWLGVVLCLKRKQADTRPGHRPMSLPDSPQMTDQRCLQDITINLCHLDIVDTTRIN
jgi:hypothetical protein